MITLSLLQVSSPGVPILFESKQFSFEYETKVQTESTYGKE